MAKWMPSNSRPGALRTKSLGLVAPVQITTASNSRARSSAATSLPISTPVTNSTPSASIWSRRRRTTLSLSSFMLGMPYMRRPPGRSARS